MIGSTTANKTHPFVGIHVEEENIVVFTDHSSTRLAPGVNPEHLTKTSEPLVLICKPMSRGGGAGAGVTMTSSSSH